MTSDLIFFIAVHGSKPRNTLELISIPSPLYLREWLIYCLHNFNPYPPEIY
jgi:hypothetical protein